MGIEDLAGRLTEERVRLGYNQASFARLLGLSRVGLRNIEAGQTEFKVNVLTSAAAAGVDVQYVLTGIKSENVNSVTEKIGFEHQAIHGNVSGIGFAGAGSKVQVIHTSNHRTITKAETKPGIEHISEDQKVKLKALVDEVVEKEKALKKAPKSHASVWASVNKHCGVTTYSLIKLVDFDKARKFLSMWLGRLNSSSSAPIKDGDKWRKSRYAYIKVNSKEPADDDAVKAYITRKYSASSLTELSNVELEEVYRYVAGRQNKKRR